MKYNNCFIFASLLAASSFAAAGPCGFFNQNSGTLFDFGGAPPNNPATNTYGTYLAKNGSSEYECLGSSDPVYQLEATPAASYGVPVPAEGSGNGVRFLGSFLDQAGTQFVTDIYRAGLYGKVEVDVNVSDYQSVRYDSTHKLYLDGWLDFGHNGVFGDQSGTYAGLAWNEHIVSKVLDPSTWGSNGKTLAYTFVNGPGPNGPFYARFRLNYDEGVNTPIGVYNTGSIQDFGGDIKEVQETPEPSSILLIFAGLFSWVSGIVGWANGSRLPTRN